MRPTEMRLRRAFTAVLAAAAGHVACGGGTTDGSGGTAWQSLCSVQDTDLLAGLTATPPIDGAVYRNEQAFLTPSTTYDPGGGVTPNPTGGAGDGWVGTSGTPKGALCAKASDPAACQAKIDNFRVLPATRDACVAAYPYSTYQGSGCGLGYILYTRGDEIGVARTPEETRNLAATIDTVQEALWAARVKKQYQSSYCGSSGGFANDPPESMYRQTADGGWDLSLLDYENCGNTTFRVTVHVDYAGNATETDRADLGIKPSCAVAGRRPAGLEHRDATCRTGGTREAIGAYLADLAMLEAAAITSFRRMHRELARLGAPASLLDRVRDAARDEIRHARAMRRLAEGYGASPALPRVTAEDPSRDVLAIALENATEGCVRETFGALVAHLQSSSAADPAIRAAMRAIADEETSHAALSWDVARFLDGLLSPEERAAVARARAEAVAGLAGEIDQPFDAGVSHATGLPGPELARSLLAGLAPTLVAA